MKSNNQIDSIPARATRKEWIGLVIIALPCIVYAMDLTVLNLAIPHMSADLKPKSSELLWIIDIYGFMVAGMLITMGTLGDRIGRRKLLMIGAACFAVTSVIAALSTNATMLIIARALLGIAGATVAPSTLSLIRNMFPDEKQRTFAIGVWITSYSIGGATGPLIGGALLDFYPWQSVFLVSIPVMLLLLICGPFLLPEYKDPDAGKLDLLSAAESIIAVLAVIFGLKKIAEAGISLESIAAIVTGIMFAFLFIKRQLKLEHPLIDLKLFRVARFNVSLIAYMLAAFISFGTSVFISQYLQLVLGLSPLKSGLWTLPWSLGFIAGALLTPAITKSVSPAKLMSLGFLLGAVGYLILSGIETVAPLAALTIGSVIVSFSMAPIFTLTTDFILASAPPEKTGAASAISETSAEMGGALGIAILGSIGTAFYRLSLQKNLPDSLPGEIAEASKDTLAAALSEATKAGANAEKLVAVATQSFIDAFQAVLLVCSLVALVLSVMIYLRLKQTPVAANIPQTR